MADKQGRAPPAEAQPAVKRTEQAQLGAMDDLGETRRLNLALEGEKKHVDLRQLEASKRAFQVGTAEWRKLKRDGPRIGAWKTLAETNDDPADQPLESDMGYGQSHRIALLESRGKQPLGRQDARSMYQLGGSHGRRTGAAAPSSAKNRPFGHAQPAAVPMRGPQEQRVALAQSIQNFTFGPAIPKVVLPSPTQLGNMAASGRAAVHATAKQPFPVGAHDNRASRRRASRAHAAPPPAAALSFGDGRSVQELAFKGIPQAKKQHAPTSETEASKKRVRDGAPTEHPGRVPATNKDKIPYTGFSAGSPARRAASRATAKRGSTSPTLRRPSHPLPNAVNLTSPDQFMQATGRFMSPGSRSSTAQTRTSSVTDSTVAPAATGTTDTPGLIQQTSARRTSDPMMGNLLDLDEINVSEDVPVSGLNQMMQIFELDDEAELFGLSAAFPATIDSRESADQDEQESAPVREKRIKLSRPDFSSGSDSNDSESDPHNTLLGKGTNSPELPPASTEPQITESSQELIQLNNLDSTDQDMANLESQMASFSLRDLPEAAVVSTDAPKASLQDLPEAIVASTDATKASPQDRPEAAVVSTDASTASPQDRPEAVVVSTDAPKANEPERLASSVPSPQIESASDEHKFLQKEPKPSIFTGDLSVSRHAPRQLVKADPSVSRHVPKQSAMGDLSMSRHMPKQPVVGDPINAPKRPVMSDLSMSRHAPKQPVVGDPINAPKPSTISSTEPPATKARPTPKSSRASSNASEPLFKVKGTSSSSPSVNQGPGGAAAAFSSPPQQSRYAADLALLNNYKAPTAAAAATADAPASSQSSTGATKPARSSDFVGLSLSQSRWA